MDEHRPAVRRCARVDYLLPYGTGCARWARRRTKSFLRDDLHGHPACVDDAELVVSELVTNATRAADGHCRLTLRTAGDELTVEVHDDSPVRPRLRPPSATAESGRGIALVHALTRRWSVVDSPHGGKTVRAVLARG